MKQLIILIALYLFASCTTSTTPKADTTLYKVVDTVKKRLDKTEIKVETLSLTFTGFSKAQITQINSMITTVTTPLSAQIKALQDSIKLYQKFLSSDFSSNSSGQLIFSPAGVARIKPLIKAP